MRVVPGRQPQLQKRSQFDRSSKLLKDIKRSLFRAHSEDSTGLWVRSCHQGQYEGPVALVGQRVPPFLTASISCSGRQEFFMTYPEKKNRASFGQGLPSSKGRIFFNWSMFHGYRVRTSMRPK